MKETLAPGLAGELRFTVPVGKTVPHLYPESDGFAAMPEVLATGFMVGLVEWACIDLIAPHLDEGEMSLGVHVNLSHDAATPPGLEVAVRVRLEEVERPSPHLLRGGRRRGGPHLRRPPPALRRRPGAVRGRRREEGTRGLSAPRQAPGAATAKPWSDAAEASRES